MNYHYCNEEIKMRIFISWSKDKSRQLAEETKKFISNLFGNSVEFFFSPEMYKGTRVDNQIHEELLKCDKCLVCITSENFKNPWLLYEAGIIFGSNHSKTNSGIVIPILFEPIPDWSSWIDKPLNQYVPIQMQSYNREFDCGKRDFKRFMEELANELNVSFKYFNKFWSLYEKAINEILEKEQLIPDSCRDLVDRILEKDDGNFSIVSPEITKNRILFHKGFSTHTLTKILLESVVEYQGKRLWFYGRRNKKLLSGENDDFFKFLASEGLQNGVDFRCLLPFPNTEATIKATCREKERSFLTDLQTSMEKALYLKKRFKLPTEKLFKLYKNRRNTSIIISDNAVLKKVITCDGEGYPLPYTNTEFEIMGVSDNSAPNSCGNILYDEFLTVWDEAVPLTEELYNKIYN